MADCTNFFLQAIQAYNWDLIRDTLDETAEYNSQVLELSKNYAVLRNAVWADAPTDILVRLISPHNINANDCGFCVPHELVRRGRWDLVPFLVHHGADLNTRDQWDETLLHTAISTGYAPVDIVTQLISYENINMSHMRDGREDKKDGTPLHMAVGRGLWHLVPVLVQNGANPFLKGILPQPPKPHSLQSLSIATIRKLMPVWSDEAFKRLEVPHLLPELKLKPLADEIVAKHRTK